MAAACSFLPIPEFKPLTPLLFFCQVSHGMELIDRHPQMRGVVLGWFGPPAGLNSCPADAIAQQAFEAAKTRIADELTEKERDAISNNNSFTSMHDFTTTLSSARSQYESKKNSKAYVWLEKLSSRVVYYGGVLDVLVQHNPEYVSLVWGTFKFLFTSVLHHEEMVKNLAKSCAYIADTLPRADLSLILYPTGAMREAVARLYAVILRFIVHSVRWYRQSRLKHILTSITKPWSLDYEPELREVEQHARSIDNLAQSGSQAELREAHFQIHHIRSDLQVARGEIRWLTEFVEDKFQRLIEFASANQSLQHRISEDVASSKQMISHVQLGQILSLSFMESLPTSGQCLAYCRSFWLRRRSMIQGGANISASGTIALQKITSNSQQQDLSFLVLENRSPTQIKDFLLGMINLLHRQRLPVLWALRSPNLHNSSITSIDVIRMLLYQALQINSSALSTSHPITIAHLREASSHEDWLTLLKRALDGLPTVYMIVDPDVVQHVTNQDKGVATGLLVEFVRVLGPNKARFVVSSHVFEVGQAERQLGRDAVVALNTEGPRPDTHAAIRRRLQASQRRRKRR
ncbi:hypothetical protein B0H63DRAFT_486871 [Podospora didyma]|uniref:DUF7708 domain-containing protein n=1 Tax=Podospora didyma TaxID=330526 RepID=A0AAE0K6H9_9PEZI|nr:hypothetical protein B0H63DRAFT_486871 [Podospora didyma]